MDTYLQTIEPGLRPSLPYPRLAIARYQTVTERYLLQLGEREKSEVDVVMLEFLLA